jgi:pyridoxine 4-dehydrogenase
MTSKNLGGTFHLGDHVVHRVGYGAMQLPGPGVMGPPRDRDAALAVLRRAVELGVDHIDTAQYYGPDVANELIRAALYPYPDELAFVSKVGANRDDAGGWVPAQTPAELRAGVEANLSSLGVERLTAVNLRLLDHSDASTPAFEDQLAEMATLRDEGKIGGIGVSNVTVEQVQTAIDTVGIVCVQNPYSLVDRSGEPLVELTRDHGVAFVPFFPLGSAFPGMPKVADNANARSVAQRLGVTPAQVGLAWLLQHAPNILLIPGTSSVAHLEENLAVADVALSENDVQELESDPR